MSPENGELEGQEQEQSQNSAGQQIVQQGKQQAQEQIKKQAQKKMQEQAAKKAAETAAKTATKVAAKSPILAAGPVLFWVLVVILAIIVLVGIIMFFMTVPGMVMEQLKSFASDLADAIASWFGADSTKQIKEQEIYDVLNYLEEMGYDLKGYGFISKDADSSYANYDETQGVIRDPNSGKINDIDQGGLFDSGVQEAHSEIISLYIMSDNYVYTVKNFNNVSTWWTGFKWIQAIGQHIADAFGADNTSWGRGLISIYREDGGAIGKKGDSYSNGIFSWNSVKVDAANKKLIIRRGWGNNSFEYNLDGWIGRYGMPLEFLLSLHIATLKPDLTSEMVTEFDTDVEIMLRSIESGSVEAAYLTDSGKYVSYSQVEAAIHGLGSDANGFINILNWFDDTVLGKDEAEALFNLGFNHTDGCTCTYETVDGQTVLKELSGGCKDFIKSVVNTLDNTNDYDFETFVPYLARVTNHWFRDVYFVLSASEASSVRLTKTDIDYEKQTNERWTLYEKYTTGAEAGNYILYEYDENAQYGIGALYDADADGDGIKGTQQDADKEGIKVVKKQEKAYISDLASSGVVTLEDDGSWSAYNSDITTTSSYEPVYPDSTDPIEKRIYYKVTLPGSLTQKEDGVRGVTNAKIKDMFLNRYYFNYDGSVETANVIKAVRDKLGMSYGAVDESKLENEYTINVDGNSKTYKVKDLVGNVTITQDSLAAFSMLENTHTKDSDFIYKDFKELIVELGYFTKEDLSDGRAKLLQWLIPEIGSSGYPIRSLDKRENDYGTLAHSKEDYEINQKNTLAELMANAPGLTESPEGASNLANEPVTATINKKVSFFDSIASLNVAPSNKDQFISVKAADISACDYTVTPTGNSGKGEKTADLEVNGVAYEMWKQTVSTCTLYSLAFMCNAYTGTPFLDYVTANGVFINATAENQGPSNKYWTTGGGVSSWQPLIDETGGGQLFTSKTGDLVDQIATALGKGIPVYFYGSYGASAGYHAVVLLGKDDNGSVVIYNPGGGTIDNYGSGSFPSNLQSLIDTHGFNKSGHIVYIPDNPPEGVTKVNNYEGYKGNEAVVSPVTGILLEYGTYTEEDGDEYRKNVDAQEETDKVGYAKILVLNEDVADQIVSCTKHGTTGKITAKQPQTEKEFSEDATYWTDMRKSLYGYSLFCEDYENGGIAGYLLYIDGFKCELPGVVKETSDENAPVEIIEPGQALSMEYFEQNAAKGNFTECKYEETLYKPDEVYNLISEKIEEQQKARAKAKEIAAPLYSFTGTLDGETKDLLIIKEGTVIGRTLTDKELVEEYRGDVYKTKEEATETVTKPDGTTEEVDTRELRGNYLRIIMRDLDDTVVENVEEYMKLEDGEPANSDWELFYWLPFESGGTDLPGEGPECQGTCSGGETAVGIIQWTVLARDYHDDDKDESTPTDQDNGDKQDMNNIAGQFINGCLEQNSSLCAPLSAYSSWSANDFWLDYKGSKQFQATLTQICNTDREEFLKVQMEVAKKQYLEPILEKFSWLKDRPSCVQGEIMHLAVWGAEWEWVGSYQSKSDEEILKKVRNVIANTSSTAGEATGDENSGRAYNEPEIGLRILDGSISTSDVEQYVRKNDTSVLGFNFK